MHLLWGTNYAYFTDLETKTERLSHVFEIKEKEIRDQEKRN